jgi:hypothetical protein
VEEDKRKHVKEEQRRRIVGRKEQGANIKKEAVLEGCIHGPGLGGAYSLQYINRR